MRGNLQVPIKWVLVMLAVTVLAVSTITAVTPLGEKMNALAVTIAGDVVCSQCVGINGDGTNDIKDGSVTNSKIASSAVTGSKIASNAVTTAKLNGGSVTNAKLADGAVTASKISTSVIIHRTLLDDSTGNSHGWNPDNTKTMFTISDPAFNAANSVVFVNIKEGSFFDTCSVDFRNVNTFEINCAVVGSSSAPDNGSTLDYVIITKAPTPFPSAATASPEPTPRG